MIWIVGAIAVFLLLVWVGREVRLGKFKGGPWFQQFRAVRGVVGFILMALAISQMARGAWAVGIVLAVLSLIVSSSVRFATPFRPTQPQPASSFTPEEVRAYQTLDLPVGADRRAVKEAWKRLMKAAHPDQGGDVKRASALNAARDLLLRRR
ncbi:MULTISPECIES: molecular chaperone DnaJ [Asticcacaulis]|uniref:molecular chaperone DnaJ n=1 Tax=Asticcacaulis TaxID=76890 RepID=UPI001AEB1F8E|nr:molecular chaperone DnaJ [Asticcacaulis sp. BE141]MBP2160744.1 hypothetical protein [Asticcacaulis solisilvae]MDR6801789.1 hypothetical protein [Asticcacaulis sp. BE141]